MITSVYNWATLTEEERKICLSRPVQTESEEISFTVEEIIRQVRSNKDLALYSYTDMFDGVDLDTLLVSEEELSRADELTSEIIKQSIKTASENIWKFHQAQLTPDIQVETFPGAFCQRKKIPLQNVGLYIPGGSAPLVSTLTMLAIPALIAGCKNIILCTPPDKNGEIHPAILNAANQLGIKTIFKVGGAQAIAAMAYGTESIPKVQKIFGPGNAWVTEAKIQVSKDVEGAAIDMPAGPSEVLVIADKNANADFVAADLLSQAEHDPSSQVILVSDSEDLINKTTKALVKLTETLSRKEIITKSLAKSRLILVDNLDMAFEISNTYAPEHLILQIEEASSYSSKVLNAGSVFVGSWTPESVGDYASGTNHVLPTYGYAKTISGLGIESFMKTITFQELTPQGLKSIAPTVECLAQTEGLSAHKLAVTLRVQALKGESL